MPRSFRSPVTRVALLCSAVLLAPLAMADTPAPAAATQQPAATPAPALTVTPTHEETRDAMRARRHADHEAFFSARLAALHAGLQLKPDQEALWAPVETAIREFGKLRAARWADRRASLENKGLENKGLENKSIENKGADATDALRKQADRLIARGNAMKGLADATAPLLGSLGPDQKGRLPMLLDGLKPKQVLARAFALDDHRDERQAWGGGEGREHEGWGRGMRHEHWAERGMRDHDDRDRRADRFDRRDDGFGDDRGGFEHHHHGWDRAERDGMRDEEHRGPGDRPMPHHHGDDAPDRT